MTAASALSELPDLVPPEVSLAYGRWLAERPGDDAYLFTDARVRFEANGDDIVVAAPGLAVHDAAPGARLTAPSLARPLAVAVPREQAVRFFEALDGESTLAEASSRAALEPGIVETLVGATFGVVLFAPLAVAELERRVPAAEIVRFPGSPYEIPRSYWSNMASVRRLVPRLVALSGDPLGALEELRRLHVVSLVGESGASFYRPASPIAKKGLHPGKLWLAPSRTLETPAGTRFVEGPRVNAAFVGGDRYGALLAELAGDPAADAERLEHRDATGLEWGRVIVGRAEGETEDAPWFCPPRPLSLAHVTSLFASLSAGALADFHQKLVRLHPFRAANQSLAMSIVNGVSPAGIPHLVLDQLALRLSPQAYRNVFSLAALEWQASGSPAERLLAFAERRRRSYALIELINGAPDVRAARRVAEAAPADARIALLAVPGRSG